MTVALRVVSGGKRPAKFRVQYSARRSWSAQRMAIYRANLLIGAMLREIRTARGVTQAEVAKALRVTASCVCLWEGGHYSVSSERARHFREAVARIANHRRRSPLM